MPWQSDTTFSEILAIHIALMPRGESGEVLLLGGDEHWGDQAPLGIHPDFRKTRIFDVQSGSVLQTPIASPDSDVFCSGHAYTADGRLLIIGGTLAFSAGHGHALDFWGHRHCWLYHSQGRKWVETAQLMPQPGGDGIRGGGRWYPGAVTLGDGDVLTMFGHVEQSDSRHRNTTPERYNVQANAWRGLPNIANDTYRPQGGEDVRFLMYPRTFVLPDGRVFFATPMPTEWEAHVNTGSDGPHRSAFYNPDSGLYVGTPISNEPTNYRQWTFPCVLLPLLPSENYRPRVLHCGASQALRIDLGLATPTWEDASAESLGINRRNSCAVLLPTGEVCLVGGVQNSELDGDEKIQAELYDPRIDWTTGNYHSGLGVWKTNDNQLPANSRNYHSAAILLPTGQVLTCGGDKNSSSGDPSIVGIRVIELYNPPYYAASGRLTISNVPRTTTYGHAFTLTVSDTTRVSRIAFLRNGSCTHAYDFDQRYVGLSFTQGPGAGQITATAPPNGNVAPPGFYMLWVIDTNDRPCVKAAFIRVAHQSCSVITNRSTFSAEEVQAVGGTGTATFDDAVLVVFDGFIHTELSGSPTVEVHWAEQPNNPVPATDFVLVGASRLLEVNPGDEDVPQRITYPFHVQFPNPNFYSTFTDMKRVRLTFRLGPHTCIETLDLTHSPNPYMIDVNPIVNNPVWLSTDVRVFSIETGQTKFTDIMQNQSDPISFIQSCIEKLNSVPNGNSLFESLATDATIDAATLSPSLMPIYNYAIARVRYRAKTTVAQRVRCFFRMFNVAATGLDFEPNGTYRRTSPIDSSTVPLLGTAANNVISIPFFASQRVETVQGLPNARSMRDQTLAVYEIRDIVPDSAGTEVTVFFGAWLDINQTKKRFPLTLDPNAMDGPYPESACRSIQEHIRGRHECIVAEVFYEGDLTDTGETPGSSDNLSQRNLAVLHSDNPGSEESHTSMHTLEIKPSKLIREDPIPGITSSGEQHTNLQMVLASDREKAAFRLDELLFRWHNLPAASTVTLTFSAPITTSMLLSLAQLRLSPLAVNAVDETTLSFPVPSPGGLTYLTIPPTKDDATIPSLLSISIPADAARAGRVYRVTVHQVNGRTRSVIGSAEFQMKVSKRELILEEETRTLSVFKHIVSQIPRDDRWWEIMQRYVYYMGIKVDSLGGNASTVHGNPNGSGRPYDPNAPVNEKECTCCDDDSGEDDHCADHGTYIGHVCAVHYSGDGRFVGFAVKLCAKPKKGKGEKGEVKFFRSSKRDLERVVVEAQREDRSVKVVIGTMGRWWWKVIGVKCVVVCGCA